MAIETTTSVDVKTLTPFKRFIMTIGILPTSYLESMTYAELVMWFCNFLQNEVIPTVNNNAQAVKELQDYINNLDLQDEVNNKLDEMAESGELQEIITAYLNTKAILTYDTVNEMLSSTNLIDGSYAKTLGFYTANDGGGALYKIRNIDVSDIIDNATIIQLSDELVAEFIEDNFVNVKQLGAKGDNSTDDTDIINIALTKFKNILIKDGTYMIDAQTHLSPTSNTNIEIVNATLKAIPNNLTHYAIIDFNNVSNICLKGGIIEGERSSHLDDQGEWGHGISITNSNNITIKDLTIQNCWGDGLYLNSGTNIKTSGIVAYNNRRNGYSIISVDGFKSENDLITNTNGTNPQAGVDLEPNSNNESIKNCIFNNLTTKNNNGAGFKIHLVQADLDTLPFSIVVNNFYDYGSLNNILIDRNELCKGSIVFNEPVCEKSYYTAIQFKNCKYGECGISIIKPTILNCNRSNQTGVADHSGIAIFEPTSIDAYTDMGNIYIYEPYITFDTETHSNYIYSGYPSASPDPNYYIYDLRIENPRNHIGNIALNHCVNVIFKDEYKKFIWNANASATLGNSTLVSEFYSDNYTANRTITLPSTLNIGSTYTFYKTGNYNTNIKMPSDTYIYSLLNTDDAYVTVTGANILLNRKGQNITIKKFSATEYFVLNNVGDVRSNTSNT